MSFQISLIFKLFFFQTAYESTTWQSTRSSPQTALTSDVDGWEVNPPSPDRYQSDSEANPQPEIELQTMTLDMTSGMWK